MDRKNRIEGVSRATWIPFVWMFLAGSREVSAWLNRRELVMNTAVYLTGNPLDRAIYMILVLLGVLILYKRHLNWRMLFRKNIWIFLYFLFGMVSFFWSDYPFVSFKRWIKALGNVVMALVVLTEMHPYESFGVILRRLAFLILPLSVLFIKYYPALGRAFHYATQTYVGVATQKNGLGQITLIFHIYFLWKLLLNSQKGIKSERQLHFSIYLTVLPMIAWLLYMANSATAIACMVIASSIILISRLPIVTRRPTNIMVLGVVMALVFVVLEVTLGLSKLIIIALGRDPSLTERVPMWHGLLAMQTKPVVGVGYESFWLGERLNLLWRVYGTFIQSHNGYIDIYLNLGFVGLALMVAIILFGLFKIGKQLKIDYPIAILKLTFIIIIVVYNFTESTFYGISNMWLLLFLVSLDTFGQQDSVRNKNNKRHQIIW